MKVRMDIANTGLTLKPGMFADAILHYNHGVAGGARKCGNEDRR